MAELQINELSAAATELETLDYFAIDNDVDNTRKILASTLQAKIRNNLSDAELATLNGVSATLTAAELNKLDGFTGDVDDLNYLSGVTAGTTAASKALVLNSDGDGGLGRNMTISGTLGVDGAVELAAKLNCNSGAEIESGDLDINANNLILDLDGDSKFLADHDDILQLWLGGTEVYRFDGANFGCASSAGCNLGGKLGVGSADDANEWHDLNLANHINIGASTAPENCPASNTAVIYLDTATKNLRVRINSGGSELTFTLATYA